MCVQCEGVQKGEGIKTEVAESSGWEGWSCCREKDRKGIGGSRRCVEKVGMCQEVDSKQGEVGGSRGRHTVGVGELEEMHHFSCREGNLVGYNTLMSANNRR